MTKLRTVIPLALACWTVSAQEPSSSFTVRSDLVYLPTRVETKKGGTIYGLQAQQFIVEDNGVRQPVKVDETPDAWGISLVVVVQCGRSAPTEFGKLKGLGTMIDAIAGGAPREVAVVSYGEGPHLLGDFSSRSDDTTRALAKLKACGDYSATTIDAVSYAIGMLDRRQNPYRKAILLISETRDHGSKAKLDEVAHELGVSDAVIYTVAFAPVRDEFVDGFRNPPQPKFTSQYPIPKPKPKPEAAADDDNEPVEAERTPLMQLPPQLMVIVNALRKDASSEIASLSGGEHFSLGSQKSFDESLLKISNRIHNYYLLSFKPAGTPGVHTLRVRIEGHPEAVIQTRRNYPGGISAGQ